MRDNKQVFIKNNNAVFQNVIANFDGGVRHDNMEGRAYLVAPMIMMVAGVVDNGVNGALLYPAEELSKVPGIWNSKPVVVYHPTGSACDPDILSNRGIGRIMNTRFEDNKLKAEAWIEKDRANEVDERVMEAIENNSMMEVSTGLCCEITKTSGTFDGKDYEAIVKNISPDHLAILPDQTGACSIEDGAGLLRLNSKTDELHIDINKMTEDQRVYLTRNKELIHRNIRTFIENELGHDDIRSLIWSVLSDISPDAWIEDVFDDFFIYVDDGVYYRQGYSSQDDKLTLVGEREQVSKVTEFRRLDGTVLNFRINRKELKMDKKKFVEDLIANKATQFTEGDTEFLMNLDEKNLEKMAPVKNEEEKVEEEVEEVKEDSSEETVENKVLTMDEHLATLPAEISAVLKNSIKATNEQKDRLIEVITKNEKNTFSKEVLKGKGLDELQSIANLACEPKEVEIAMAPVNNYAGQGETSQDEVSKQEPMGLTNHKVEKKDEQAA